MDRPDQLDVPSRSLKAPVWVQSRSFDPQSMWAMKIGGGSFSSVWTVREMEKGKRALKISKRTPQSVNMFVKEMTIIHHLDHPNIVSGAEAILTPTQCLISMPFYSGGTLTSQLRGLTDDRIAKFLCQLCSALMHVHDKGIAHRDVKPANILLSSQDDVILIDFGLSNDLMSRDDIARTSGTSGFVPPENYKDGAVDYYKCDWYALGVVLMWMVFRRNVCPKCNYFRQLDANLSVPSGFRAIIKGLIDSNMVLRWQGSVLTRALHAFGETFRAARRVLGPRPAV